MFSFEAHNDASQNEDPKKTKSNANFADVHVDLIKICSTTLETVYKVTAYKVNLVIK